MPETLYRELWFSGWGEILQKQRSHTLQGSVRACYSNDSKELDYHPHIEDGGMQEHANKKGKEKSCLSDLRLNRVRLQIIHSPFHPISPFVTHNV